MLKQTISLSNHKPPKRECGVIFLALGHPFYGRMAYNAAMVIKALDHSTHITLVYTASAISHINQRNMWVFDNKMEIDDVSQPFGVKLLLNELTPYDRTLYMDVDTIWINREGPSKLLEQLKGIPFTGITEGMHDFVSPEKSDHSKHYYFWADLEEIKEKYPLEKWAHETDRRIFQWRGEFIYFEKSESINDLFDLMKIIYGEAHELKSVKKFANYVPDELAINIATAMMHYQPHIYKWQPTYWDRLNGGNMPSIDALQSKYYAISCGSNYSGGALKRVYDRVVSASAGKIKLQHVFPLVSKKEMILNRQLM